jgi:diguanylate cyclase (GGDEF)-like protein
LLAIGIDGFEGVADYYAAAGAARVVREAGRAIEDACGSGAFAAVLAPGRFGVLLTDAPLEKAQQLAENVRLALAALAVGEHAGELELTASVGIAAADPHDADAAALVARAELALADAQRSGGDACVVAAQFEEERRQWLEKIRSGYELECSIARDVMTPLTVSLRSSDTIACAAALFAQTGLDVLPVFDAGGKLLGIVESESMRTAVEENRRGGQPLEPIVERDAALIADTTPFPAVIDQFIQYDRSLLVVTHHSRPVGYIARERFLSLVKPIQPALFAATASPAVGSEYLLVPDLVELDV